MAAVLAARDRRAQRQQQLLAQYGCALVSFTMNIAGPVKRSAAIDRAFALGLQRLEGQLRRVKAPVLRRETVREDTGCEALLAVEMEPAALKALCVEIEEWDRLGRLFDMDVLAADGTKLERPEERGCLICGRSGRGCGRSRRHSVEELQRRTEEILEAALADHEAQQIARLAVQALLYEACTAPKPGLVDRYDRGSHRDMDIFTFMASAAALQPYFSRCARVGRELRQQPAGDTLAALRSAGRMAEGEMYRATGGVNTHRGAVFLMGLACGALGRLEYGRRPAEAVLALCGQMAAGLGEELGRGHTEGDRFYRQYGVGGIRREAELGFPAVRDHGLPMLRAKARELRTLEAAGCWALLALMARCEDTALMHRGGYERWQEAQALARQALERGVSWADLAQLDEWMVQNDCSPGGSADLLALCYLLYFVENREAEEAAP